MSATLSRSESTTAGTRTHRAPATSLPLAPHGLARTLLLLMLSVALSLTGARADSLSSSTGSAPAFFPSSILSHTVVQYRLDFPVDHLPGGGFVATQLLLAKEVAAALEVDEQVVECIGIVAATDEGGVMASMQFVSSNSTAALAALPTARHLSDAFLVQLDHRTSPLYLQPIHGASAVPFSGVLTADSSAGGDDDDGGSGQLKVSYIMLIIIAVTIVLLAMGGAAYSLYSNRRGKVASAESDAEAAQAELAVPGAPSSDDATALTDLEAGKASPSVVKAHAGADTLQVVPDAHLHPSPTQQSVPEMETRWAEMTPRGSPAAGAKTPTGSPERSPFTLV